MPPPTSSKCQDALAIIFLFIFWPVLLLGILPLFTVIIVNYVFGFLTFCYKNLSRNKEERDDELLRTNPREFWKGSATAFAKFWWFLGRVWHGYEIRGLENIPDSGPAILIAYHAAFPLDAAFILSAILFEKDRRVVTIVNRDNEKIPGYKTFSEVTEQLAGTVDSCAEIVDRGELMLIYPGGVREAALSDEHYEIVWPERAGFGKVAVKSQCKPKIIPIFTENCRDVSYSFGFLKGLFYKIYLKKKTPVWLPFGWFPVKMISHVGKPIEYDDKHSVEEIVQFTKDGLKELIDTNQRIPGSVWRAFLDRFSRSD